MTDNCKPRTIDLIVTVDDPEIQVVEDDIREDLSKVGITVITKFLESDSYIEAERDGSYNMLFTRTWVCLFLAFRWHKATMRI